MLNLLRVDPYALARRTVIASVNKSNFALSFPIFVPLPSTLCFIYRAEFPRIISIVRILLVPGLISPPQFCSLLLALVVRSVIFPKAKIYARPKQSSNPTKDTISIEF